MNVELKRKSFSWFAPSSFRAHPSLCVSGAKLFCIGMHST